MQIPQLSKEIEETIMNIVEHIVDKHDVEVFDIRLHFRPYKSRYYADCSCGKIWQIGDSSIRLEENREIRSVLELFFKDKTALKKLVEYRKNRKNREEIVRKANSTISSLEV